MVQAQDSTAKHCYKIVFHSVQYSGPLPFAIEPHDYGRQINSLVEQNSVRSTFYIHIMYEGEILVDDRPLASYKIPHKASLDSDLTHGLFINTCASTKSLFGANAEQTPAKCITEQSYDASFRGVMRDAPSSKTIKFQLLLPTQNG